jgi:type VI secretion system protein VasG
MRKIVELQLGRICRRTEVQSGARNVDHILTRTLLPELSAEFLAHMAEGQAIARVRVG